MMRAGEICCLKNSRQCSILCLVCGETIVDNSNKHFNSIRDMFSTSADDFDPSKLVNRLRALGAMVSSAGEIVLIVHMHCNALVGRAGLRELKHGDSHVNARQVRPLSFSKIVGEGEALVCPPLRRISWR